jgi:hypothetical protein
VGGESARDDIALLMIRREPDQADPPYPRSLLNGTDADA